MLSDLLCLESGLVRRLGAQVPFLNGFLLFSSDCRFVQTLVLLDVPELHTCCLRIQQSKHARAAAVFGQWRCGSYNA